MTYYSTFLYDTHKTTCQLWLSLYLFYGHAKKVLITSRIIALLLTDYYNKRPTVKSVGLKELSHLWANVYFLAESKNKIFFWVSWKPCSIHIPVLLSIDMFNTFVLWYFTFAHKCEITWSLPSTMCVVLLRMLFYSQDKTCLCEFWIITNINIKVSTNFDYILKYKQECEKDENIHFGMHVLINLVPLLFC